MSDELSEIRVQIAPLELVDHDARARDLGGGLVERLVTVDEGTVMQANVRAHQPFASAEQATYTNNLQGLDVRDHAVHGVRLRVGAIDGNPLVTAALLWPIATLNLPHASDLLVALPRFSAVIARPIFTRREIGAAAVMASVARLWLRDSNDGCSPFAYWWRLGRFHRIDIDDDGTVVLDAALDDAVQSLPA
ncbi:hypothetical protein [Nakamurella aerolata]|uniref:Uncharacterized protein n=1 Tax=Nakamurella aerolata TaxID=1656892 RepID=A0A849AAZ2_9ACTN|nr:hypothetical protein [Nakamurella aerolata]NNG36301.1 hypothetical protein [Nakamurella aerolata]